MAKYTKQEKISAEDLGDNEELILTVASVKKMVMLEFQQDDRVVWLNDRAIEDLQKELGPVSQWAYKDVCIYAEPGSGQYADRRFLRVDKATAPAQVEDDEVPF